MTNKTKRHGDHQQSAHSTNPFGEDELSVESSIMSASEMPTYSINGDDDTGSSAVLSASQLHEDHPPNDAASVASESLMTSHRSKESDSDQEDSVVVISKHTQTCKNQSRNFRFKRGSLIGAVRESNKSLEDDASTEESDDDDNKEGDDIESGAPDSDYAARAPRSIWQDGSFDSMLNPKNEESESVVDDEPTADDDKSKPWWRDRQWWKRWLQDWKTNWKSKIRENRLLVILGATLLLIIVIVVAISASIPKRRKSSNNGNTQQHDDPTPMPLSEMHQKIHLAASQVVDHSTLSNETTMEYRVFQWLLDEDTIWTQEPDDFTVERIVQRFVLVHFYFSMGGESSWDPNTWLQGEECGSETWDFINCNEDGEVRALAFENVGLVGQIPSLIYHLPQVENFIIKKELRLTGTIPPELGHMAKLKQLGLYYTGLSGSIPKEIFKASRLSFLSLRNNNLQGGIPTEISNLDRLDTLVLMNNRLGGEIPWQSLAASGVNFLGLSNNEFHGQIPEAVANLTRISFLYLDGNNLDGELPSHIGRLSGLESLNLDNNKFRGHLPPQIGQLSKLTYFSMQYNQLSGHLPSEMDKMRSAETIALGANRLTGVLPHLKSLKALKNLYLFNNTLHGPIQRYLLELPHLRILFLSSNAFSGGLPAPHEVNSNLVGLYVSDNQLDGDIKSSVCMLQALQALFLDENNFSGELPACMGVLGDLIQFYAFKNKFTGTVPVQLSSLQKLEAIGLEDNNLAGQVPPALCSAVEHREIDFWSDCGGGAFAEVNCDCCSMCCREPDICSPQNQ